jgi:hypothetical protein
MVLRLGIPIMKKTSILLLILILLFISLNGCSGSGDNILKQESLGEPFATIEETEAGFNQIYRYSITFPLKQIPDKRIPGLQFNFEVKGIENNKEISFDNKTSDFSLDYSPLFNHNTFGNKSDEFKVLNYTSRHKGGSGKVIFEKFEPKIRGQLKGKIIDATLYGVYITESSFKPQEPEEEKIMKIKDLPFETIFQKANY